MSEIISENLVETKAPAEIKRGGFMNGGFITTMLFLIAFFLVSYSLGVMTERNNKITTVSAQGNTINNQQAANQPSNNLPRDVNSLLEKTGKVPPLSDKDHVRGDKNAKVTLIEYSDFECPFCKKVYPTMNQILDQYKGKIKIVYRHFPLSFHANAQKEAEASECANELGGNDAFWKYHDKIFERTTSNGTGFALDKLVPLAKEIGLDENKFKTCLDSGKYAQYVKDNEAGGQSAGITGTPGNIIMNAKGDTKLLSGALPFELFKQALDQSLKE